MFSRFLFLSFLSFTTLVAAVTAQTTRQDDERAADKAEIRAHNGKRTTASGRGSEIFVIRDNQLVNTGWHLDAGK